MGFTEQEKPHVKMKANSRPCTAARDMGEVKRFNVHLITVILCARSNIWKHSQIQNSVDSNHLESTEHVSHAAPPEHRP